MINRNKLLGIMAENNFTGKKIAEKLGMTPKTFYVRMKKGDFGCKEIEIMVETLNINDPMPIFFPNLVTFKDTKRK